MNPKPAASVIIPVLNGEKHIGELLVALKAQAGVPDGFEILVIDNGSTDRTVEVVRGHGVTPLHQPKRGPGVARNLGLAHAKADIIVCVDSDCIPSRRYIATLLAAMADPTVGIATGPILGWQPTTAAERYINARNSTSQRKTAENPKHPYAFGMHTTFRRAEGVELGGWDETMDSGEDMDFCFRYAKRFKKPIRYIDHAVLFHKHRSTDEALWKQSRWHGTGYAAVQRRHPEMVRWGTVTIPFVYLSIGMITATKPIVWCGGALRLLSRERVEFENYHRRWFREFWGSFLVERRKRSP